MNLTNVSVAEEAFIRQKYLYWIDAENTLRTEYSGVKKVGVASNKINASDYLSSPNLVLGKAIEKAGASQPRYLANGSIGNNLPTMQNPDRFDTSAGNEAVFILSSRKIGSDVSQYFMDSHIYNTPIGHNNHTIFLVMRAHITVGKRVHVNESILSVGQFPTTNSNPSFSQQGVYTAASFGSYQIDCGQTGWNNSGAQIGFRGTVRGIFGSTTKNILPTPTSVHSNNNSNILEIVYDADNNRMSGFANGTAGFQNQTLTTRLAPGSRIALFCNRGLSRGFRSEIGELIVINSVDSADRNYVREYLSGKWGISIA